MTGITIEDLKTFQNIRDELEEVALAYNLIKCDAYCDIGAHDINDIDIEIGKKEIHVSGDYYYRGCSDNFYMRIPFAFLEDPDKWEDDYHEECHQENLRKIQARVDKEKEDARVAEAFDRNEYERLKKKYE